MWEQKVPLFQALGWMARQRPAWQLVIVPDWEKAVLPLAAYLIPARVVSVAMSVDKSGGSLDSE